MDVIQICDIIVLLVDPNKYFSKKHIFVDTICFELPIICMIRVKQSLQLCPRCIFILGIKGQGRSISYVFPMVAPSISSQSFSASCRKSPVNFFYIRQDNVISKVQMAHIKPTCLHIQSCQSNPTCSAVSIVLRRTINYYSDPKH